jgi:hypothetical protein
VPAHAPWQRFIASLDVDDDGSDLADSISAVARHQLTENIKG